MTTYVVTSDRLSRKRGEKFEDDELGGANVAALVAAGHLTAEKSRSKQPGHPATDKQEK